MNEIEARKHGYRCPKCRTPMDGSRRQYYCPKCLLEDLVAPTGMPLSGTDISPTIAELDRLRAEVERLREEKENAVQQARTWKQEAMTQRGTVEECYKAVGSNLGDWNGADPIRAALLTARAEERERCARVAENRHKFWHEDGDHGVCCDLTACEDIAAAIRKGE